MAQVRKTARAEQDLEDIWLFIAQDSIDAADRWATKLDSRMRPLAENPHLGRARPEWAQALAADLRSFAVAPYVLIYRPITGGIQLVRVLHGARDVDAALNDES